VCYVARFDWKPDDPEIVSDVLFAVANVLSIARTTYLVVWWFVPEYRAHHLPGGVVVRPSAPYPRGTYSYLSIARTTYLVVWWYDRAHRAHAAPTRT